MSAPAQPSSPAEPSGSPDPEVEASPAVATSTATEPEALVDPATPAATDEDVDDLLDEVDAARPDARYGLLARVGAELVGTFAVVLATVTTLLYVPLSSIGTLGVALAAGLTLAGMHAALAHVSGAHLNPAISLASALAGRMSTLDATLYVVAQVLGGVVAALVALVTVPSGLPALVQAADAQAFLANTANGYGDGSPLSALSSGQVTFGLVPALVVEVVGTAILTAVVLGTRPRGRSGLAIGLTYAAMLLVTIPVTNGGLNPARATAVALTTLGSGTTPLGQLWLFWVAPLIGAAAAGLAKVAAGRRERFAVTGAASTGPLEPVDALTPRG
jgi:aquaporin Z